MAKNTTVDMTSGNPIKHIIMFSLPLLFGNVFQQVYNIIDTMIVGKTLGVDALAAVGSTGSLLFLIMGFCIGVCSGFALPIAQSFGAGDYKRLKKFVGNSLVVSILITIIMTIATTLLCNQLLIWMKTPDNIFEDAYNYLIIMFIGIPITIAYNLLSSLLRSLGDSQRPLYFLVIGSVVNIGLDFLFISGFHWGVIGAATATVASQLLTAILCLVYIIRDVELLHFSKSDLSPDRDCMRTLFAMGLPMGFQYSITAIGVVILQASVNMLGSVYVAAITSVQKVDMFLECPFAALGNAMATFAGQNVGAGKPKRIKNGTFLTCAIGSAYSVLVLIVIYFVGPYIFQLFVDKTEVDVIHYGQQCLLIYTIFFVPLALLNIIRFTIQGMGFSGLAVFAGIAEMFARSIVGIVFVPLFGFIAACFAGPVAWIAACMFLIPAFFVCYNKIKKMLNAQQ